jgi:hypothetical protein
MPTRDPSLVTSKSAERTQGNVEKSFVRLIQLVVNDATASLHDFDKSRLIDL